ncbi:MAG: hypothetical protein R2939_13070 [Kofleriaceae bacterium]
MKPATLLVLVTGLCAGLLVALLGSRGAVYADARPSGCGQWEVSLATIATTLPGPTTQSTSTVEKVPAGWEPFAYMPTGQLAYRRCAK